MTASLVWSLAYLVAVVGIGLWAGARSRRTQEDYFLGGRRLSAFVMALSAVTSGRSSWLLIGVTGLTWLYGYSAIWYFPGYIAVELLLFLTLGRRLRERSAELGAITIPEVLAGLARGPDGREGSSRLPVRQVAALVVMLFLITYVSAQLVAGGKALESIFAVDGRSWGLGITAGIVLFYTLIGGYQAVAWTDVLQAFFMLCGLVVMPLVALADVGGTAALHQELQAIDPGLVRWSRGWIPLVGGLAIGLGSFGNPHILVRLMSIDDPRNLRRAAWIGTFWNVVMALGAFGIGLVGRALFPELTDLGGDREHVYTSLGKLVSERHFFAGFIGILLAALFASIMSTCDSQLLVVASSLVRDFRGRPEDPRASGGLTASRVTVFLALVLSVAMVFLDPQSRFVGPFVLYSWAALGAAFGPPLILLLYDRRTTARGVLAGIVAGVVVVVVWRNVPALKASMYELLPGFLASLATVFALRAKR